MAVVLSAFGVDLGVEAAGVYIPQRSGRSRPQEMERRCDEPDSPVGIKKRQRSDQEDKVKDKEGVEGVDELATARRQTKGSIEERRDQHHACDQNMACFRGGRAIARVSQQLEQMGWESCETFDEALR